MPSSNSGRATPSLLMITLLICALAAAAIAFMVHDMVIPQSTPVETDPRPTTTAEPSSSKVPDTTEPPPVTASTLPDSTAAPDTTAEPAVTTEPPPPVITLPEAETPAGDDYFASILFIGDSRSQGMQISTGGYGATFYADRGLSIEGVSDKKFIKRTAPDGSQTSISIIEALTAEPVTEKIYIWLGLNELGWPSSAKFEKTYRTQLAAVREACPDADIVIMSLVPVGRNAVVVGVDTSADANKRVIEYNEILLRLAEEAGVYYLNCYEAFVDAEGYLPDGYASDGIHLVKAQNIALCDYIRAHPIP